MTFKLILVPLDGSPLAEEALPAAAEFARKDDGTLVLIRAAEARPGLMTDEAEAQVNAVREAEAYLAIAAERVRALGARKVETSVWYGPPADIIVDAAEFRRADLIVMSTHGRSGLRRLVLGSVTESVLRSTPAPVFLLRPRPTPLTAPVPAGKEAAHV